MLISLVAASEGEVCQKPMIFCYWIDIATLLQLIEFNSLVRGINSLGVVGSYDLT